MRLWENTLLLKRRRDDPADELKKNMNAQSIAEGIAQLVDAPSQSTITEMTSKLRRAEKAKAEAEAAYEAALKDLAMSLIDDGDGWTKDEIWMTGLRGSAVIMETVRANGK